MKRKSWVFLNFLETVQYFWDRGSIIYLSFVGKFGSEVKMMTFSLGKVSLLPYLPLTSKPNFPTKLR